LPGSACCLELLHDGVDIEAARLLPLRVVQKVFMNSVATTAAPLSAYIRFTDQSAQPIDSCVARSNGSARRFAIEGHLRGT
jgi:hypothetical protein